MNIVPRRRERAICETPTISNRASNVNWITGFHAVEEALAAGRALDRIVIARGRHGERVEAMVQLAKASGVPVRFEDRAADRPPGGDARASGSGGARRRPNRRWRWKICSHAQTRAGIAGAARRHRGSAQPGRDRAHGAGGGSKRRGDSRAARGGALPIRSSARRRERWRICRWRA